MEAHNAFRISDKATDFYNGQELKYKEQQYWRKNGNRLNVSDVS